MSVELMHKLKIKSNMVKGDVLRQIQSEVLSDLSNILKNSFGPMGSNTCIKKEGALNQYSKDGHTILSSVFYNGIIEQSIKDDVESITRHIVKAVGDGTTSAVILSSLIFDQLADDDMLSQYPPAVLLKSIQDVVDEIKIKIEGMKKECTVEDIYDICMTSTNGNEEVSDIIRDIYRDYGMDVFIDVTPSTGPTSYLKEYNGMTLHTGYSDSTFVNNASNNTCTIDNPEIYFFEHPIDTKEMSVLFDYIIYKNIIEPLQSKDKGGDLTPTVIFAPKISQDVSTTMDALTDWLNRMPASSRPPILIVTDMHQVDEFMDMCKLCSGRMIHKYIDAEIYKKDIEAGNAPTPETIKFWAGKAEQVISDSAYTKVINPCMMYDEEGNHTEVYQNLLNYLQTEVDIRVKDGTNINEVGTLKRRLNSLKSNMVEYFVGGITAADRDSVRDLVEDAVLNCRAAVESGVCPAANTLPLIATDRIVDDIDPSDDCLESDIAFILHDSYRELMLILYSTGIKDEDEADEAVQTTIKSVKPYNLRTNEYDDSVKSSIKGETVILDTVSKIIGIMVTCNQFLVPTPMHNIYQELYQKEN